MRTAPSNYPPNQTRPSEYIARQHYAQQQHPQSHPSSGSMAQATSPSMSLQDGHQDGHQHPQSIKSNSEVPVDPNIAASSPTYPPYSPYAPHDMSHYQGQPPPGYPSQHSWPQHHPGYPHGMPYSSPGSTASGTPASAGPRPGQVSRCASLSTTSRLCLDLPPPNRILTRSLRSTLSYPFLALSSTSDRVADMKR